MGVAGGVHQEEIVAAEMGENNANGWGAECKVVAAWGWSAAPWWVDGCPSGVVLGIRSAPRPAATAQPHHSASVPPPNLSAGLTQTLNEFRQTTHQLQRLQSHEVRRLQKVEATKAVGGSAGSHTSPAAQPADAAPGSSGSPQGSPKPLPAAAATPPYRGGRSAAASPAGVAAAAAAAAAAAELSAQAAEATRLAEQLEDVAGGADSGLLAEAAVALRELAKRDAELVVQQQVQLRVPAKRVRLQGGTKWVNAGLRTGGISFCTRLRCTARPCSPSCRKMRACAQRWTI